MKKTLFFLPVLLLVLIACNNNDKGNNPLDNTNNNRDNKNMDDEMSSSKGNITGKWRLVAFTNEDGKTEDAPSSRSMTVEFTRDGNYISTTEDSDGETNKEYGSYTYDARTKTLETIEEKDGKRESIEVEFRGKNKMILTSGEVILTLERD